jgi:predicted ester cyclase
MDQLEKNKEIVRRFNYEFIAGRNMQVFEETVHPEFINQTVPAGAPGADKEGTLYFINMMHAAFPDLQVEIHQQVAEGDLVTTYKTFTGTHSDTIMGIEATGRKVQFRTIDILRIKDGQAIEHWSVRDNMALMQQLTQA